MIQIRGSEEDEWWRKRWSSCGAWATWPCLVWAYLLSCRQSTSTPAGLRWYCSVLRQKTQISSLYVTDPPINKAALHRQAYFIISFSLNQDHFNHTLKTLTSEAVNQQVKAVHFGGSIHFDYTGNDDNWYKSMLWFQTNTVIFFKPKLQPAWQRRGSK